MKDYLFTFNAQQLSQQLKPFNSFIRKLTRPQTTKPKLTQLKQKRKLQQINQLFENNSNDQDGQQLKVFNRKTNFNMLKSFKKKSQYQFPNLQHLRLKKNQSGKQNQINLCNKQNNGQRILVKNIDKIKSKDLQQSKNHQPSQVYFQQSKRQLQNQQTSNKYRMKKLSISKILDKNQKKNKFDIATPKILYPQSDKKLPSAFKIRNIKQSPSSRSNRINSSKTMVQSQEKESRFLNNLEVDSLIRTKFRPQSMMISTQKRYQTKQGLKIPKKLIFNLVEDNFINKLMNKKIEQKRQTRSSHQYRRLRQTSEMQGQNNNIGSFQKDKNKNLKQSAQNVSTTQTIQTPKLRMKLKNKNQVLQKELKFVSKQQNKFDLTCSIAFQLKQKIEK